ncbi:NAD-dependent epimerase/dehydratase family protein [Rhodococcus erythropolis]|uniref:NAD-dependent epimerase/dehydratase family protein n=1 Tax=Rhodococcus erythropolis TaxID=1833 RepID=UPI000767BA5A|nr:NAD-dependent epimerase/dehydratase family protein [Rhodococcus erythropolis]MBO8147817.1 NAD-dependent epimerase/dehydratase family protein [Rhodococcus erythropolis]MDO1488952.1 NAD-dependent epimerase/dehydratase family protein [Rhodococcus erythropolis]GCB59400.1 NAD-dependent epimerase [Rhodococcus erythropolis]
MSNLEIVTGAGPVGSAVALQLAEQGINVRLLTRSGSGPEHPLIDRRRVDVSDSEALRSVSAGATAIYHCIHAAYNAADWERELPAAEKVVLDAAASIGAVVVFPESLYAYNSDTLMTESDRRNATGGKRGVRTALLRAREASATPTVSVVASDFFGPRVRTAHAGERMVPKVMAGKKIRVIGSADQPHSFTYIPDLAAAMIAAAHNPELWNSVIHAPTGPALTQRKIAEAFARAAGASPAKVGVLPAWVLDAVGKINTDSRELAEMNYQFTKPFVMDSSASEVLLGLSPTPLDQAAEETVAWWRAEQARTAAA